jgi:hypothetical protein
MKTRLLGSWLFLSVLLIGSVVLVPAALFAQPSPPHVFIGKVISSDGTTPLNAGTIAAWVDGMKMVEGPIRMGTFRLLVISPAGMSLENKKVKFTVDGEPAGPDQTWVTGGADQIELTLSSTAAPPHDSLTTG